MEERTQTAFEELMVLRGGLVDDEEVQIIGSDPFYKTPFKLGETTAHVLAACGVAANDIWEMRSGRRQKVTVLVEAAAASLADTRYTFKKTQSGKYERIPGSESMQHMVTLTQPWQTADGKWFLPHTNLGHLEARVLGVLNCESQVDSLKQAIASWDCLELENAISAASACGGMVRTPQEWLEHPQGSYLASKPVVEISKISEGSVKTLSPGDMPLSGVRVLDLTRILAGPLCGLTLAELGADVLMVTAPHLPQVPEFVRDTSHGKRTCFLDLNKVADAEKLKALVAECDVIIDGYRPDRLAAYGFGVDDLVKINPNLIHVNVNCFGSGGPFGQRAGWDQVAQTVTGMCHTQGMASRSEKPQLTPVYGCDYICGRLGAFGAMVALARRAREGGSYSIHVSLCQAAMLCQRQGYISDFDQAEGVLSDELLEKYQLFETRTSYGDLKVLGPVLEMSETPCKWSRHTPILGQDKPEWITG